jgi:hypothetical protein
MGVQVDGNQRRPDVSCACPRFEAIGTAIRGRPRWEQWSDLTTMASHDAARHIWSRVDLKPSDADVAEMFDGFIFLRLIWTEALSFCDCGQGGGCVLLTR